MTKLGLSVDEVLTTTRAVRRRLDVTRPVSREMKIPSIGGFALEDRTGGSSGRQASTI